MGGRLTRFLNLERPRKPGEAPPQHEAFTAERFKPQYPPPSGMDVAPVGSDEQPFVRCPTCEADNQRQAERCFNCQTRLDTEDVRAWNAAFWEKRRAAAEPVPPPPEASVEQNRLLGEALAREVAEREQFKMGTSFSGYSTAPLGMRLLELIGNPNTRFAVAMAMVALFFAAGTVAYVAKNHPVAQTAGIVVAVALLVLFTPNRSRRRRFWDDW